MPRPLAKARNAQPSPPPSRSARRWDFVAQLLRDRTVRWAEANEVPEAPVLARLPSRLGRWTSGRKVRVWVLSDRVLLKYQWPYLCCTPGESCTRSLQTRWFETPLRLSPGAIGPSIAALAFSGGSEDEPRATTRGGGDLPAEVVREGRA